MSFCTTDILSLASGVYVELNSPPEISVGYISGILTSTQFIGEINNRLNTCFYLSGDGPCIQGGFDGKESYIYALLFETQYLQRAALTVLQNGGSTPWISLADGDGRVARESTAARSKAYRDLGSDLDKELRIAVNNYIKGHSLARSVDYAPLPGYPSP